MFQDRQLIGSIVAMVFIISLVACVLYFTRKLIAHEKILFVFILIATILSAVWVVDNVIALKINLLDEKEDDAVLQIMTTIVQFTLGFYFGSKVKDN
jgi:hypothetical protein